MIRISDVSFSYKKDGMPALHRVGLDVKKGECILLTGRSGCGKTTITKLINGLVPYFYEECELSGNIHIDGLCTRKLHMYEIAKKVGSVFQNPKSQFFYIDSDSELTFSMENSGTSREVMLEKMEKTINALSIENLMGRNVFQMSGGEKQALAFASSYISGPDILVLDEPTANLDAESIQRLMNLLAEAKGQGKTMIIAEHRLWFLKDIADKVLYVKNGRILKEYDHETFFALDEKQRAAAGLRNVLYDEVDKPHAPQSGALTVQNLSHRKKNTCIINKLCFGADHGEVLGIYGSNGCGKTTLLYLLSGLLKIQNGIVSYNGKQLKNRALRKLSYMVMQDVNHQLFAEDVLTECMLGNSVNEDGAKDVLAKLNILDLADMHPMALSGGQKQRLAIATAVLSGCPIILFDEPTSGLDFEHMRAFADIINDLKERKKIILLVSHDNELLNFCADRILYLKGD